MHTLTRKRVEKFGDEYGFDYNISELFERYVAATYLYQYIGEDAHSIEDCVLGGGDDQGIDIAAVIINGTVVNDPDELEGILSGNQGNSAKIIFMQAKTSESYDSKLIAKFLSGVELVTNHAMNKTNVSLSPQLVELAALIEKIAENGDKFVDSKIPCELFYVTTSSNSGEDAANELQVQSALRRLQEMGIYPEDLRIFTHGHEQISAKQKEKYGPRNVKFTFEKRQTIPSTESVDEAYIGLLSADQLLKLLLTDSGEIRPGIFSDNVRLDLGPNNPVNQTIFSTLKSDSRPLFPFLNNGLTIIAPEMKTTGDNFYVSGYQIVNGAQTSHQLIRWASEMNEDSNITKSVWIPVKIVSSRNEEVRNSIAIATNLQSAIGANDIQGSTQIAKDVEEFFKTTGTDGLLYERQRRGESVQFPKTRIIGTMELNRAVAASLFGKSQKATASPKDLEDKDSFVWGPYPVQAYFYAAWIIYRIDRFFARTPDVAAVKAAKYHIAMMTSAQLNPALVNFFRSNETTPAVNFLSLPRQKGVNFDLSSDTRRAQVDDAIVKAVEIVQEEYSHALAEGRSLRKDDVRSRKNEEDLLSKLMC